MLADLDETIRQLLIHDVPLDLDEVGISFEAPDRKWSGRLSRPTINCFLYDVRENLDFRVTDFEVQRGHRAAARREAPLRRFDVIYQKTAWANAHEDEHGLLWRVLSALVRHQTLPEKRLCGRLQDQTYPVRSQIAQPNQARPSPSDLWQVVDNRIRPALTYVVTLSLDPELIPTGPLVLKRTAGVHALNDGVHAPGQNATTQHTAVPPRQYEAEVPPA